MHTRQSQHRIAIDMITKYPDKEFLSIARLNLKHGRPLSVKIGRGIRGSLIRRSIKIWPSKEGDLPNWDIDGGVWFAACMNFCPILMVIHSSYLSSGYLMSFFWEGEQLVISYTHIP